MNKKTLVLWGIGFVVLFAINLLVELVLLPLMGLDNTPRNDIYFQSWWVVVGFWLVFGNMILERFTKTKYASGERSIAE